MIVVDTNLIAYLLIQGEHSAPARAVLRKDPAWVAPLLWRSEFRNVLATYMRRRLLSLGEALQLVREAEDLLRGGEFHVESSQILGLASRTRSARPMTASSSPWPVNWIFRWSQPIAIS